MFDEIFNQKAKWYKKIGQDAFSKPKYAEPKEINCLFRGGMKLIKDKTGKEVVSQGVFKIPTKVGLEDKLECDGQTYVMLNFKDCLDVDGTYAFRKVWV